jgi:hypothetical protein
MELKQGVSFSDSRELKDVGHEDSFCERIFAGSARVMGRRPFHNGNLFSRMIREYS